MSWPSKRTWPRVGLQEAGEDFYGGTFPRAIGAQVSKHLARLKTKCDFSNSRDGTIELCESNRFEHGHPLDEQADKLPPWLETISFDTVRTDKVSVGRGRVHRLHPGFLTKSAESLEKNRDRKSTRLNSSHGYISYAVFCLKKKKRKHLDAASCTTH